MTINLEPAYEPMVRREATPAAVAPSLAQASGGAAVSAAIAVPASAKSEGSPASASEQERKRKPTEAPPQPSRPTPVRTGTYEHRIVYVDEADRLFLDVVNRDNDEVLMRIPSETLAKFLRQAESPMPATTEGQTAGALDTLA